MTDQSDLLTRINNWLAHEQSQCTRYGSDENLLSLAADLRRYSKSNPVKTAEVLELLEDMQAEIHEAELKLEHGTITYKEVDQHLSRMGEALVRLASELKSAELNSEESNT